MSVLALCGKLGGIEGARFLRSTKANEKTPFTLRVERSYPYVVGVLLTILFLYFHKFINLQATTPDIFPVVIGISAIAVGFLMTAKSILLSIDERKVIQFLKEAGVYIYFVGYLIAAVKWCFYTTILTLVGMILNLHHQAQPGHYWFLVLWVFTIATTAACCERVIRIFSKILRKIPSEA